MKRVRRKRDESHVLFGPVSAADSFAGEQVGGKAAGLHKLLRAGFAVPRFWIVPAATLARLATPELERLIGATRAIPLGDSAHMTAAAQQVRDAIVGPALEAQLSQLLQPSLRRLDAAARYAVRSSAIGEDSAEASFAGQMDSFLDVPVDGLVKAILCVWASAYSARALTYRSCRALPRGTVSTAVIIQEMVRAACAGVLFTREPQSGSRACVICAGLGLGEGIVRDCVPVDTYRVHGSQIVREVANKDGRVVCTGTDDGGTRLEVVPEELRDRATLTDAQIFALRAVGERVERALGGPQDIEWAVDHRGRVHLLQARPIVGSAARSRGGVRLWDNSNIAESYPGITLPLTFSFARQCYEAAFSAYMRQRALDYRVFSRPFAPHRHLLRNMIGLLNGRVYYNLTTWYQLMSFLPGFRFVKASWDRMVGVAEPIECEGRPRSALHVVCAWGWCLWKLLNVRANARRFATHFAAVYREFADRAYAGASADELVETYQQLAYRLGDRWSLTLDNDFAAMAYYEAARFLCRRWLPASQADLHHRLLQCERGVESAEPLRALEALAGMIRADSALLHRVTTQNDSECWQMLQTAPEYRAVKRALDSYLRDYGDRVSEDLKLERPGLRREPARLVGAIRRQLEASDCFGQTQACEHARRVDAADTLKRSLRNPLKYMVLQFVLRRARFAISSRESMRFARTRLFGLVRGLFHELGERLAAQSLIPAAADIHYLTVDEVLSVVQGTSVTRNLAGLIELRRADYAGFAKATVAERLSTRGSPYAGELATSSAMSETDEGLTGTPCAAGSTRGVGRVVTDPNVTLPAGSYVLIARSTDPGWIFMMTQARGLIVEKGSVLSHTAIIGRELGIPTIVGVRDATRRIPDGASVVMDGGSGRIAWVS